MQNNPPKKREFTKKKQNTASVFIRNPQRKRELKTMMILPTQSEKFSSQSQKKPQTCVCTKTQKAQKTVGMIKLFTVTHATCFFTFTGEAANI